MPSIRFRLEKPTLSGLAARVAADYGPEARILDTEESVVGGFGGLFGRRVIDVTVEIPDRAAPDGAHAFSMRSRVGLAALLDDADAMDLGPASVEGPDLFAMPSRPATAPVSTQGGDFASMLDALRIDVEPSPLGGGTPPRARPALATAPARIVPPARVLRALEAAEAGGPRPVPVPVAGSAVPVLRPTPPTPARAVDAAAVAPTPEQLAAEREFVWATPRPRSRMGRTAPGAPPAQRTRAGDLLLLVGLGDDPVRIARSVRDRLQRGYVCDGGAVEGNTRRRVDDARGAVAARAYGVRSEQPVIVAYGLGDGGLDDPRHAGLLSIDSDQAWLVVDAEADPEATLEWTSRLQGRLQVDAVASVRARRGAGSAALAGIGLPEAWRELAG